MYRIIPCRMFVLNCYLFVLKCYLFININYVITENKIKSNSNSKMRINDFENLFVIECKI